MGLSGFLNEKLRKMMMEKVYLLDEKMVRYGFLRGGKGGGWKWY